MVLFKSGWPTVRHLGFTVWKGNWVEREPGLFAVKKSNLFLPEM
jgi:hypothetical protein